MNSDIRASYFLWMMSLIFCDNVCDYSELLGVLGDIPFRYVLKMDANREMDGVALRYRFGYENGILGDDISAAMENEPCSVLEMMVALCLRCAEQIIDDISVYTRQLFCDMLRSLGLHDQTNGHVNVHEVQHIVERFLSREYRKNGRGGLFTISCPDRDMRNVEIWYQMCLYLDERMTY